ncbi:MAG: hypothetical protein JWO15_3854 [Sphingomonadales bacterium]|nr:hypothetical protein [Sphingomonadales bacterium]
MSNLTEAAPRGTMLAGDATVEHRIVAESHPTRSVPRYTCACGETIDAHSEVLDEAFTFHVQREHVGLDLKPCGTEAAYRRHLRHDEEPCNPCRTAAVAADAERRAERRP